MENKAETIKTVIQKFRSVAEKYVRGETLPIRVNASTCVSTREAHVIQAIGDNKNRGVTDLAATFGISKSAASQMVSRLSQKGFLIKTPSKKSSKEVRLTLTPLGRQAYEAHHRHHNKDMDYLVDRISTFSTSQIAMLSVLFEALDEIMDQRIEQNQKDPPHS